MVVEKGYKHTDIGIIPEDWNELRLNEVVNLMTNGFVGTAKTHYTELSNGILYIQGYNVMENSFNFHGIKYVNLEFHNKNQKSCLREGDLLTVQTGDVGLTTIVPRELEGSNCHALIISRFKKSHVYSKFVSFYFNSNQGRSRLKLIETGTTMKHLNVGDMLQFKIPLPPLPEQTAIANALSDMDALIAQTEKLIEKKKAIKQGVMQELLKPKEGWVTKKLGEVGMCLRGVSYSPETDLDLDENENNLSLLRSNNIQNGLIDKNNLQFVKSHIVKEFQIIKDSDIIICMANGSKQLVGKAAITDNLKRNRYTYGAFMGCFRVNSNNNPNFIFALMESKQYRDYIDILLAGSSINNLNPGAIESMSFQIPERSIQDSVADLLGDIQKSIIKNQAKLQKLKHQKQGMMQALLTGKIRLI